MWPRNSSHVRRSSPIRRLTPRAGRFLEQGQWRAPPVPAARFGAPRPASPGAPAGSRDSLQPAPREAARTGGPPNTPFPHMFTRNAPAPTNAPFAARQDAYSSHPGRPLEPQQMNNLRAGKPAGPMQDKEAIPHPAKEHANQNIFFPWRPWTSLSAEGIGRAHSAGSCRGNSLAPHALQARHDAPWHRHWPRRYGQLPTSQPSDPEVPHRNSD